MRHAKQRGTEAMSGDVPGQNQPAGKAGRRRIAILFVLAITAGLFALSGVPSDRQEAWAEYGDVIINNYSDQAGMRPVIFPHWFHRVRFRCKICHADLGFEFKAGGNDINMLKIFDGEYCGACHNGQIAWGVENCVLCHSGKPGLRTRVHNSTTDRLVTPVVEPKKK